MEFLDFSIMVYSNWLFADAVFYGVSVDVFLMAILTLGNYYKENVNLINLINDEVNWKTQNKL